MELNLRTESKKIELKDVNKRNYDVIGHFLRYDKIDNNLINLGGNESKSHYFNGSGLVDNFFNIEFLVVPKDCDIVIGRIITLCAAV